MNTRLKFIVDQNVGKLAKLLRLLGYDTIFFTGENDTQMVDIARDENRTILSRDTHIFERRAITEDRVKALLIVDDSIEKQIRQVITGLKLDDFRPFALCLEDNRPLVARTRDEVKGRVPPYVWKTQKEYMECPECHRIYWKGTHWEAMTHRLEKLIEGTRKEKTWIPKNDTEN